MVMPQNRRNATRTFRNAFTRTTHAGPAPMLQRSIPLRRRRSLRLTLLLLWLRKGTTAAASRVIRRSGLAVGVPASRVVALPLHSLSRGDPRYLLDLLCRVT